MKKLDELNSAEIISIKRLKQKGLSKKAIAERVGCEIHVVKTVLAGGR